jgi:hypothetical protein
MALMVLLGSFLLPLSIAIADTIAGALLYALTQTSLFGHESLDSISWILSRGLITLAGIGLVALFLKGRKSWGESACRLLSRKVILGGTLLFYFILLSGLESLSKALKQMSERMLTPPDHISHQPGAISLEVGDLPLILTLALVLFLPHFLKNSKPNSIPSTS